MPQSSSNNWQPHLPLIPDNCIFKYQNLPTMEAILTSSNQMQSQLYRFQCSGHEQNVSLKSDKLISKSIKCCVLNLSGEEILCEEGFLFENDNELKLDIELKKPGIYMVKFSIDQQNIVEPLYFI